MITSCQTTPKIANLMPNRKCKMIFEKYQLYSPTDKIFRKWEQLLRIDEWEQKMRNNWCKLSCHHIMVYKQSIVTQMTTRMTANLTNSSALFRDDFSRQLLFNCNHAKHSISLCRQIIMRNTDSQSEEIQLDRLVIHLLV